MMVMGENVRRDCAYCIDMEEQGALCDHPSTLYGGEPIDAECEGCELYELRMSSYEMLDRIHVLESKLKDAEFWQREYGRQVISLRTENDKLRKLASGMYGLLDAYDRIMGNHDACETPRPLIFGDDRSFMDVMRECGIREGE